MLQIIISYFCFLNYPSQRILQLLFKIFKNLLNLQLQRNSTAEVLFIKQQKPEMLENSMG